MFRNIDIYKTILMLVPLIFSVTAHEVAHGFAAYRLGDSTAKLAGRLTLNPLKHLDFVGSFLLPAILKFTGSPIIFGYAKPVPVNFAALRDYKKGTIIVSAAGVMANLVIAVASGLLFQFLMQYEESFRDPRTIAVIGDVNYMLYYSVIINSVLAVFNLIPIPPLDGSRILSMFLPDPMRIRYARIERYGMIIIIVFLFTGLIDTIIRFFTIPIVSFLLGS
ncbi:MAG: site-2 protease family protein [Desulfobacteraceae bacterium]|nr:MAG: site-2 protease family protein [Desulfobacteraceae bacterium]